MARYRIRFFFDWGCTPFCSGNDETRECFDYPIEPEKLPLSQETMKRSYELAEWHDKSLNCFWRQEECDRFNTAVKQLFEAARDELGEEFELVNEQRFVLY